MTIDSQKHNSKSLYRLLALILWLMPLIFPVLGFLYIALKISERETIGPYSIVLLVVCLIWFAGTMVPLVLRRYREQILSRHLHIMAFYFSIAVAVLIAEGTLTTLDAFIGLGPCHPVSPSWWSFFPDSPELADHFVADSIQGSRYDYPDDPNFNRQGFRDRDTFSPEAPGLSRSFRMLLLGDSFTYGVAAVNDGSNTGFADVLQDGLNAIFPDDAIVWNTGIPGTGQAEQLLHLKKYLPILKPQFVLLAFYEGNDPEDNITPIGKYYVYEDNTWADRYRRENEEPELLSPRDAWLRSQGYGVEANSFLLYFRTTSIAYRLYKKMRDRFDREARQKHLEKQLSETNRILKNISDICRAEDAKLIAVIIPEESTVEKNSDQSTYENILNIFQGLSIEHLDLRPFLAPEDYVPAPDLHWNKKGHRKVAEVILDHIKKQTSKADARDEEAIE